MAVDGSKYLQLDGISNPGYASWLRLPKMLRIYRMVRVFRDLRKSVAHTSVTVGILRLMPLILGITHLYGCIWWYMGTVGQPHTEEEFDAVGGIRRATWVYFYEGMGEAHLWSDRVRSQTLVLEKLGSGTLCFTVHNRACYSVYSCLAHAHYQPMHPICSVHIFAPPTNCMYNTPVSRHLLADTIEAACGIGTGSCGGILTSGL